MPNPGLHSIGLISRLNIHAILLSLFRHHSACYGISGGGGEVLGRGLVDVSSSHEKCPKNTHVVGKMNAGLRRWTSATLHSRPYAMNRTPRHGHDCTYGFEKHKVTGRNYGSPCSRNSPSVRVAPRGTSCVPLRSCGALDTHLLPPLVCEKHTPRRSDQQLTRVSPF